MKITLYGRIPSKKNSKVRTGKVLLSSKNYREREGKQMEAMKEAGIEKAKKQESLSITYKFRGPDKRKRDLSNKVESINDLFVKYGLLEDDNYSVIKFLNIEYMGLDKENPRVEIEIK